MRRVCRNPGHGGSKPALRVGLRLHVPGGTDHYEYTPYATTGVRLVLWRSRKEGG